MIPPPPPRPVITTGMTEQEQAREVLRAYGYMGDWASEVVTRYGRLIEFVQTLYNREQED